MSEHRKIVYLSNSKSAILLCHHLLFTSVHEHHSCYRVLTVKSDLLTSDLTSWLKKSTSRCRDHIYLASGSSSKSWHDSFISWLLTQGKMLCIITDHKSCRDVQAIKKGRNYFNPHREIGSFCRGWFGILFFHYTIQAVINGFFRNLTGFEILSCMFLNNFMVLNLLFPNIWLLGNSLMATVINSHGWVAFKNFSHRDLFSPLYLQPTFRMSRTF